MPNNDLRDALAALLRGGMSRAAVAALDEQFRAAFLSFGSETPDNLSCVRHIEYAAAVYEDPATDGAPICEASFVLRDKGLQVADIFWNLEGSPVPDQIQEGLRHAGLPEVTQDEWDAATRFVTMVLHSFVHRLEVPDSVE
jgi:hypothetical protein